MADVVNTTTGSLYPIRDSCIKPTDPKEHCYLTDALYYQRIIQNHNDSQLALTITNTNSVITNSTYEMFKDLSYDVASLGCKKDMYILLHYFYLLVINVLLFVVIWEVNGIQQLKCVMLDSI